MRKAVFFPFMISVIFVAGCGLKSKEVSSDYALPPELSDCKVFRIANDVGGNIKVVRCPDTTTTQYIENKSVINTTTINQKSQNMAGEDKNIVINGRTFKSIKESDIIDVNGVSYIAVN